MTAYISWTRGSCLHGTWCVISQISIILEVFLSKSVYFDSTLGFVRQAACHSGKMYLI